MAMHTGEPASRSLLEAIDGSSTIRTGFVAGALTLGVIATGCGSRQRKLQFL